MRSFSRHSFPLHTTRTISRSLLQILGQMMPCGNIVLLPWTGGCCLAMKGARWGQWDGVPRWWLYLFLCTKGVQPNSLQAVFPTSQPPCPPASVPISSSQASFQCARFIFFPLGCSVSHVGEEGSWQTWFALLMPVVLPDFRGQFFLSMGCWVWSVVIILLNLWAHFR